MTIRVYRGTQQAPWKSVDLLQVATADIPNPSWKTVDAAWRYTSEFGWRQIYPNVTEPLISITSITTTENSATINWEVYESTSVLVGVYDSSNTLIFFSSKDGSSPNSQLVTGLTLNATYRAVLVATSSSGITFTTQEEFTVIREKPTAPLNVTASTGRVDGILVSWSPPTNPGSTAIVGYEIQRRQNPADFDDNAAWTGVGDTLSHLASDINPSPTVYYFKVRAINSSGSGDSSAASNAGSKVAATDVALAANRTTIDINDFTALLARIKNGEDNVSVPNIPITFTIYGNGSFSDTSSVTTTTINSNANGQATVNYYGGSVTGTNYITAATNGLNMGIVAISILTTPSAPQNLTAGSPTQPFGPPSVVRLISWNPPSNNGGSAITDYETAIDYGAGGGWSAWLTTNNTTSRSALFFGGTQAQYKVRAVNSVGGGAESVLTVGTSPSGPQNFSGTATGSTAATLTWSSPSYTGSGSVTGYEFQRTQGADPQETWSDIGLVTSRNATGLDPSTTYYFRVRAYNTVGSTKIIGVTSTTTVTTTASNPPVPAPPTSPTEPPGVTPLPPTSPPPVPIIPPPPPPPPPIPILPPPSPGIPMPPPNPRPPLSIGFGTKVLTIEGYVPVENVLVGDQLISIDIEEIETDGSAFDIESWNSETFTSKGFVLTTVTDISAYKIIGPEIIINGDSFSDNHNILTKKDGVYSFVPAAEINNSYEIYDYDIQDWTQVDSIEIIENSDTTVYSIDCEPYDIFFTNNALVYNKKEFGP